MDITKYYWKAKDENEARVIINLLAPIKKVWKEELYADQDYPKNLMVFDRYEVVQDCCDSHNRTLATPEDLLKWALNGFKEAWEIPPEGYRLVTVEERESYGRDSLNGKGKFFVPGDPSWMDTTVGDVWSYECHYAVPIDFTFPPKENPRIKELQERIKRYADELAELKTAEEGVK